MLSGSQASYSFVWIWDRANDCRARNGLLVKYIYFHQIILVTLRSRKKTVMYMFQIVSKFHFRELFFEVVHILTLLAHSAPVTDHET